MSKYLVVKYGGKCLQTDEQVKAVAASIKTLLRESQAEKIVAVVSARGSFTDDNLDGLKAIIGEEEYKNLSDAKSLREVDTILQCGENVSAGTLALALSVGEGIASKSMNGRQLGISTSGRYGSARIKDIDKACIEKEFEHNDVLVVAGFQGIHEENPDEIVTLGRGGSDKTAIAIAARLGCKCIFFKEAPGVTTVDPSIFGDGEPQPRIMPLISPSNALLMARYGYPFLMPSSLEIAIAFGVEMEFRYTPLTRDGRAEDFLFTATSIGHDHDIIESNKDSFSALAIKHGITSIRYEKVLDQAGEAKKVFEPTESVSLIDFQQINTGETAVIQIYLHDQEYEKIKTGIEEQGYDHVTVESGLTMITILDDEMESRTGNMPHILEKLQNDGVNLVNFFSSNIMIHLMVLRNDYKNAVYALAEFYELWEK